MFVLRDRASTSLPVHSTNALSWPILPMGGGDPVPGAITCTSQSALAGSYRQEPGLEPGSPLWDTSILPSDLNTCLRTVGIVKSLRKPSGS